MADEAGEQILDLVKVLVPGIPLKTKAARSAAKLAGAAALIGLLPDSVPQAEAIRNAAGLVVEAGARDLSQPQLKKLQEAVMKLAAIGA